MTASDRTASHFMSAVVARNGGPRLRRFRSVLDYYPGMSNQPLAADDIRAAAGAHHELGASYSDAVIESFLERVDQKIDARLDARLGQHLAGGGTARTRRWRSQESPAEQATRRALLTGAAIGGVATGVPLLFFATYLGHRIALPVKGTLTFLWLGSVIVSVSLGRWVSKIWRRSQS